MQYDAFISYSHSTDSTLAPSLEEGLEQFAKPAFKRSALRIFRHAYQFAKQHGIALKDFREELIRAFYQSTHFYNEQEKAIERQLSAFQKRILCEYNPLTRVAIAPDGNLVALGNIDGDIELFHLNEKYIREPSWRWQLEGHKGEPITALSFTTDNQFLLSQSKHIKRKWKVGGLLPYVQMEATPGPYEERETTIGEEARILVSEVAEGKAPELILYLDPAGDTVAVFSANEDFSQNFERGDRIVNGDFYVTPQGLYNMDNERLIALELSPSYLGMGYFEACGFSEDGNYLFAKDRIYCLDAEEIIARYQDTASFGRIAPFSEKEREDYLIAEG